MQTRITELLNIKYPIFQGGMAWVADGDLAGAVSNAGGLGIIGGGNAPKEVVKANIDRVKSITDKPFGVNIMLLSPFADDIVDLVIEEGVKVVTTGAGNPGAFGDRTVHKYAVCYPHPAFYVGTDPGSASDTGVQAGEEKRTALSSYSLCYCRGKRIKRTASVLAV